MSIRSQIRLKKLFVGNETQVLGCHAACTHVPTHGVLLGAGMRYWSVPSNPGIHTRTVDTAAVNDV